MTRRYAEFAAALTYLGKDMGDSRLAKPLSTLRALMVRFLTKMSNLHSSAKNKIVFYINNVDHILTVFEVLPSSLSLSLPLPLSLSLFLFLFSRTEQDNRRSRCRQTGTRSGRT